jgi:hypothetical protein
MKRRRSLFLSSFKKRQVPNLKDHPQSPAAITIRLPEGADKAATVDATVVSGSFFFANLVSRPLLRSPHLSPVRRKNGKDF